MVYSYLKINDMEADFKKGTKVCSKCGRELPISDFHKNKRRKDGLNSSCKYCDNKQKKASIEKYKNDPVRRQKRLDAYKRYHASEKGKAKQKEYEAKRVYTEEQREHRRQYAKEYRKENYVHKRQQKIFIIDEKEYFKCSKCGEIKPKEDFSRNLKMRMDILMRVKNVRKSRKKNICRLTHIKKE